MAAPKLRISPSGPVATDESPLSDFAGNVYGATPNSAVEFIGKIGPSDAGATFAPSLALTLGAYASPPTNNVGLAPRYAPTTFGVGTWVVDLELGVGFATAAPSTDDAAVLNITAQFKSAAGANIGAPVAYLASPLPATGTGTFGGDVVHSSRIPLVLTVNAQMIADNGNQPLAAIQLLITRASGTGGNDYTTTSGWLEVTKDTNAVVRRVR